MPDGFILPEIELELLKRSDARSAHIRRTLRALEEATSLPWTVSRQVKSGTHHYALDDTHIPLSDRLACEAYEALAVSINQALNEDAQLVARHRHRRDIFPQGEGLRFATVGGTLYNGTRLATSFLLSAALEDEAALEAVKHAQLTQLAQPIRQLLDRHSARGEAQGAPASTATKPIL